MSFGKFSCVASNTMEFDVYFDGKGCQNISASTVKAGYVNDTQQQACINFTGVLILSVLLRMHAHNGKYRNILFLLLYQQWSVQSLQCLGGVHS